MLFLIFGPPLANAGFALPAAQACGHVGNVRDSEQKKTMTKLDRFLVYAELHRGLMCGIAVALLAVIAWMDSLLPTASIGFLYLIPVLLSAAALNTWEILIIAVLCGILQETFSPLKWAPGVLDRLMVATTA